jgi:hypothetical protein
VAQYCHTTWAKCPKPEIQAGICGMTVDEFEDEDYV